MAREEKDYNLSLGIADRAFSRRFSKKDEDPPYLKALGHTVQELQSALIDIGFEDSSRQEELLDEFYQVVGTYQKELRGDLSRVPNYRESIEHRLAQLESLALDTKRRMEKRRPKEDSTSIAIVTFVFGLGLGAFFLVTNFFGSKSAQLSPGEEFNLFGGQFYLGLILVLIGAVAAYFWMDGSKRKKVSKRIASKKSRKKKRI